MKDLEPAFPQTDFTKNIQSGCEGMSLRDYFAGQALISFTQAINPHEICGEYPEKVSKACYLLADAMLQARESKGEGKNEL